ncbi:hypothetical protein ACHAQH_004405 [Verticillium albo-atrum]
MRNLQLLQLGFVASLPLAQADAGLTSKQGLALHGDAPDSDNEFLSSEDSPISWYYTWSPWPSSAISDSVAFLPLLHGLDAASDDELLSILGRLPASSTHLLTFNEPDHDIPSGGSDISPEDAAEAYLEYVVPLREGTSDSSRTWNISHPVVTGSGQGIKWLRRFNESCYDLDPDGCPTDFVAVHYYGDFPGLAAWIGTLDEFYNPSNSSEDRVRFWITEMALPQQDEEATIIMLNDSMTYLDGLDLVEGYAWFGAFRTDNANDWTGDSVSLFDGDGELTKLGATYLGGEENGFEEGMKGAGVRHSASAAGITLAAVCLLLHAVF